MANVISTLFAPCFEEPFDFSADFLPIFAEMQILGLFVSTQIKYKK